jgi:tight adherence protein C
VSGALVAAAVAAFAAVGVVLFVRGLVGTTTPLAVLVDELHRPRGVEVPQRWRDRMLGDIARTASRGLDANLAVREWDAQHWLGQRCLWAIVGALPGVMLAFGALAGIVTWLPASGAIAAAVVGAPAGWLWARADLASTATKARKEFRYALSRFLSLTTIMMAGGAGVDTALFEAAAVGRGPAFRQLRTAISAAQARRQAPWATLGELGRRIGVADLEDLEASMHPAGDGARIRDSLVAQAHVIREKAIADTEAAAESKSETMALPVALMFCGFLLLVGYPAMAALGST